MDIERASDASGWVRVAGMRGFVKAGTYKMDGLEMRCVDGRDDHDWTGLEHQLYPKGSDCSRCGAVAVRKHNVWWVDWPLADVQSGRVIVASRHASVG